MKQIILFFMRKLVFSRLSVIKNSKKEKKKLSQEYLEKAII